MGISRWKHLVSQAKWIWFRLLKNISCSELTFSWVRVVRNWNSCSDEGLTLETSATHQIPQAKNRSYQPLLIKPVFSLLANAEKTVFFKASLPLFSYQLLSLAFEQLLNCDVSWTFYCRQTYTMLFKNVPKTVLPNKNNCERRHEKLASGVLL